MKEQELVVVVVTALALEFESVPVIVSAVLAALVAAVAPVLSEFVESPGLKLELAAAV